MESGYDVLEGMFSFLRDMFGEYFFYMLEQ